MDRAALLTLDRSPDEPGALLPADLGLDACEACEGEHRAACVSEPSAVFERLGEPALSVLESAELERAVDHRAQRAGAPPAEPRLLRELRTSSDELEALLGIALRIEDFARESERLRFAAHVAVRTVTFEARIREPPCLIQIAAVERRIAETQLERRDLAFVAELAE